MQEDGGASRMPLLTEDGDEPSGELYPFATVKRLSRYIPELDPESERAQTLRVKMSKRSTMLRIQLAVAFAVVVTNFAVLIWALKSYPPDSSGLGTFYFGDCSQVSNANTGLHVALNIISSLFLAAANYCMQILVSPSRLEVLRAHSKGTSLVIGVQNITNLAFIDPQRRYLWLLLGFLSVVLHLCWNSVFFTSSPFVSYPRAIVTSDVLGVPKLWDVSAEFNWDLPAKYSSYDLQTLSSISSLQQEASGFRRLTTEECIDIYIDPLKSTSSVLVVGSNITAAQNEGSSLIDCWISGWDNWSTSNRWLCAYYYVTTDPDFSKWCTKRWLETFPSPWKWASWMNYSVKTGTIDYCLVGPQGDNSQLCGLHYSLNVFIVVCVCTFTSAMLILCTWLQHVHQKKSTLVTMGDAIAEFLKTRHYEFPDVVTMHEGIVQSRHRAHPVRVELAEWSIGRRVSWIKAVSGSVWSVSLILISNTFRPLRHFDPTSKGRRS